MAQIHVFLLPYDSGRWEERMGAGPGRLVENGLADALRAARHSLQVHTVEVEEAFPLEIGASFALYRRLAGLVQEHCARGAFPLVLSGNCGAALGGIAGLSGLLGKPPAVAWLDAHGDFNTPDTTRSGFLDGMGLATAAGLGWKTLASGLPGFRPVPPGQILHAGGRNFDPAEEELFARHGVALARASELRERGVRPVMEPLVEGLAGRAGDLYLHFDVDALDPAETPANQFAVPGGLLPGQVGEAIDLLGQRLALRGMGLASYDPLYDPHCKTCRAVIGLVERALRTLDR
jgi:arginase